MSFWQASPRLDGRRRLNGGSVPPFRPITASGPGLWEARGLPPPRVESVRRSMNTGGGTLTTEAPQDDGRDAGSQASGATGSEETGPEERSGGERGRGAWGSLSDIQEAVSDLVDSAIRNVAPAAGRHPRYDLVKLPDDGYALSFDLPGVAKADVDVSASDGELTVEGTRARPALPAGAEVLRTERAFGRFRRTVRIPADVDVGRIAARMTDGVLEVTLPRKDAGEARTVEVE